MRVLKIVPYFLCVMFFMALLGSIFTTFSDYILVGIYDRGYRDESMLQRLWVYFILYFPFSFVSFFPPIIIFLSVLQLQLRIKTIYIILAGVTAGALFGFLTQRSIFSFYIHSPEREIRYIFVIATCMIFFPHVNRKSWRLFNRKRTRKDSDGERPTVNENGIRFLKIILYFIYIMLALVMLGSILTTISDYILCGINSEGCRYENTFERLGTYTLYYLFYSFVSFFFLIIIVLLLLQLKFRLNALYVMFLGLAFGIVFSYFTQELIMSLYTGDEKKLRYILVVTTCMALFPFINKKLWEIVNKKKEKEIS